MDDLKWAIARSIPHLRRYAIALTRNADSADDLVQESLEKALRKRHHWRRTGNLRSWLFSIVYRTYLDRWRSRARVGRTVGMEAIDSHVQEPPNQEPRLHVHRIVKALDRLPDDQRETILLVALEGLTYDEVADAMNVPVGTVRSRLSRGRRALREMRETEPARYRLRRVK